MNIIEWNWIQGPTHFAQIYLALFTSAAIYDTLLLVILPEVRL